MQNPEQGVVRFEHDHYLKMWALTEPKIDADFLFLDEAQDTNPVLEQVFAAQRAHTQLVMVGDSAQAIYGWRGARDVMTGFDTAVHALTDEDKADVTVSTAHKAKDREWSAVKIADDFPPPPDSDRHDDCGRPIPEPVSETDARLAYVAVTRARSRLDLGGLAWIDDLPAASEPE